MTDYHVAEPARVASPAPAAWQRAQIAKRPRTPRTRRYAMTPPTYFAVEYAINPWMDVSAAVDVAVAQAQWENLRQNYLRLGHQVDLVEPVPGLPDMVYAANGGFVAHDV
ncbi:MAG: N-dimethylarginine dimethylaminohydrolase, partial [Mycobacterium sp.]